MAVLASFNEAGKVGNAVDKIPRSLVDKVVVVDDGSTDGTGQEARSHGATVITHAENLGAGAGYRDGYFYGLEQGFDIVVELAGDDQDVPDEIPRLLDPIVEEDYDYVHGSRWLPGGRRINHPFHRTVSTRMYSVLMSCVTLRWVTDGTNGFRAFKPGILRDDRMDLRQTWLNKYELEPYLYYHVITLGYRWKEVPVTKYYPPHDLGYTKMRPITSWWSILRPLVLLRLGLKK